MKKAILYILLLVLSTGCHTYVSSTGKKFRQAFPAKDKTTLSNMDTNLFTQVPFTIDNYLRKVARKNNKKTVTAITGKQLQTFLQTNKQYIVYFLNPSCSGPRAKINQLDSLAKVGSQVIVISMRNDCNAIDNMLRSTTFSNYPYYTIQSRSKILLDKQRDFTRDACKNCYIQYKDRVIMANYLLIDSGVIKVVM